MEVCKAGTVVLSSTPATQPLLEMVLAVTLMLPFGDTQSWQGRGRAWHPAPWVLAAASWRLKAVLWKCCGCFGRGAQSRHRLE